MEHDNLQQDVIDAKPTPTPEQYYKQAERYFEKHGNLLNVYKHKNNHCNMALHAHLDSLRVQYQEKTLDPAVKEKYDKLGMVWENVKQKEWEYCYNMLVQYKSVYGSLIMSEKSEIQGVKLHDWLTEQREAYKKGELSLSREAKMQALDPKWAISKMANTPFTEKSVSYYVGKVFPDVKETYRPKCLKGKELDIYIPSLNVGIEYDGGRYHKLSDDLHKNKLCEEGGIRLIRIRDSLCPRMVSDENCTVINRTKNNVADFNNTMHALFSALGVKEHPDIDYTRDKRAIANRVVENESRFRIFLKTAKLFYKENGHLFVPKDYQDEPTGVRLGQWIRDVRESKEFLSENQVNALSDIGMVWTEVAKEKWLYNFRMATCYDEIPADAVTTDNQPLQEWFEKQKEMYMNFELSDEYKFEAMEEKFGLPEFVYEEQETIPENQTDKATSKNDLKQEQTKKDFSDKKQKKDKHKRRGDDAR